MRAWLAAPVAQSEPIALAPNVARQTLVIHADDVREVELVDVEALSKALNPRLQMRRQFPLTVLHVI